MASASAISVLLVERARIQCAQASERRDRSLTPVVRVAASRRMYDPGFGQGAILRPPAAVAQLVEHFTRNEGVSGSSPLGGLRVCGEVPRPNSESVVRLTASSPRGHRQTSEGVGIRGLRLLPGRGAARDRGRAPARRRAHSEPGGPDAARRPPRRRIPVLRRLGAAPRWSPGPGLAASDEAITWAYPISDIAVAARRCRTCRAPPTGNGCWLLLAGSMLLMSVGDSAWAYANLRGGFASPGTRSIWCGIDELPDGRAGAAATPTRRETGSTTRLPGH